MYGRNKTNMWYEFSAKQNDYFLALIGVTHTVSYHKKARSRLIKSSFVSTSINYKFLCALATITLTDPFFSIKLLGAKVFGTWRGCLDI